MHEKEFGREITTAGFSYHGDLTENAAVLLAEEIVAAIGMTISHPAVVTSYPATEDKPSPGFIVHQPIIESFVDIDVWPVLGGGYIHIVSCKDFEPYVTYPVLEKYKLKVRDTAGSYLSI